MAGPRVGIVVIGRNEGERLVACLASVAPLELPIVYVDSASSDGSRDVARAVGAMVVELDMTQPFTAARARNAGAEALTAAHPGLDHVQFVDGDCTVAPGWIETARGFLDTEPRYAIAFGEQLERHPTRSFYNRLVGVELDTPVGDATACGGNSMIRRAAFDAAGGFDPAMVAGEEPELCSRLIGGGWRVRRLDAAMITHDAAIYRFGQWWGRAVRSGFGYAQAWRATRRSPTPLYRRELARAIGWTVVPPALAIGGALLHPAALSIAPLSWMAQIARLAWRFGAESAMSWQRAGLLMLGKAAEAWGAAKFAARALRGETGGAILYK